MTSANGWERVAEPGEVADALVGLYVDRGDEPYDEVVSQTVHGVQTALLAAASGARGGLVVAALFHDIGHLFEPVSGDGAPPQRDLRHEVVGARFLARWFGPRVTDPIRYHVDAKRFLCGADDEYAASLSPASVHSLGLQGGPMSSQQRERFVSLPGAADAVRLRRWDDAAKDPHQAVPELVSFHDVIRDAVVTAAT